MKDEPPRPDVVLRESLPTTKFAVALFDLVVSRLGDRAVVHASKGGKNRMLFARAGRDGALVIPWPLLSISIAEPPADGGVPEDDDRVIEPEPDPLGGPAEATLGGGPVPAAITIHDGALTLGVEYRWNGNWRCSCEPGERDAFADLVTALTTSPGDRVERLADYVASIDVGRHGPARVFLPRMTPGGVAGVWNAGRAALRVAMASRRSPSGSFWAVADGYVGTALAFGTSREDAFAAWRKEVERVRPKPPSPKGPMEIRLGMPDDVLPREWTPDAPSEPMSEMRFSIRGWDAPPFDPSPAAVPAAAVRLAALPASKPAKGTWTRWLGDRGATHFAVRLPIAGGYTLVGEPLLPLVDLETLDAKLDALDEENPGLARGEGLPAGAAPRTHATVYYRCIDLGTGLPIEPRADTSDIGSGFDAAGFDGSRFRSHVVRVRQLAAD